MQRITAVTVLLLAFGLVGACGSEDHQLVECDTGQKVCDVDGRPMCVSTSVLEYGCGQAGCEPCALYNATSVCNPSDQCAIASCEANYDDCNVNPADGCETDTTTDVRNCGECAIDCSNSNLPHVLDYACGNGVCVPLRCEEGWADQDEQRQNGCETAL